MSEDERTVAVRDIKMEDAVGESTRVPDGKPSYKSWKKKYRKMRIVFDQKMHESEDLHRAEQKGHETSNRLAVEIDRLLDLLLEINSSAQMPVEKRFDLGLDLPSESDAVYLDADDKSGQTSQDGSEPAKALKALLRDIPHLDYAATASRYPEHVVDLQAGSDRPAIDPSHSHHPPSFLAPDDLDNYLWAVDQRLVKQAEANGRESIPQLPTLAPHAHTHNQAVVSGRVNGAGSKDGPGSAAHRDFALRNPASVYNWLRKHEPKVFLQDGESTPADKENGDDHHGGGRGRKSTGERGGARAVGSRSSKRGSAAHTRGKQSSAGDGNTEYMDDDTGVEVATPNTGGGRGKRKRNIDDDPGYRPKGGSSRPTKKKRKSEGGGEGTPTAGSKRPRKSDAAAVTEGDAMDD